MQQYLYGKIRQITDSMDSINFKSILHVARYSSAGVGPISAKAEISF